MHRFTREDITKRFMEAVAYVKFTNRNGGKNNSVIAKAIGAHQQNMSKYAEGSQSVTTEHIAAFCEYFDMSESYILRGKGALLTIHEATRMDQLEQRISDLEKRANK